MSETEETQKQEGIWTDEHKSFILALSTNANKLPGDELPKLAASIITSKNTVSVKELQHFRTALKTYAEHHPTDILPQKLYTEYTRLKLHKTHPQTKADLKVKDWPNVHTDLFIVAAASIPPPVSTAVPIVKQASSNAGKTSSSASKSERISSLLKRLKEYIDKIKENNEHSPVA